MCIFAEEQSTKSLKPNLNSNKMKRTLSTFMLLLAVCLTFGQNSTQKKRIKEIREEMERVTQLVKDNSEDPEYTDNSIHLQMNRMLPGAGMQHYNIDMYITDCGNDEMMKPDWRPYFFRIKYNVAAVDFIHEVIVSPVNNKPVFHYYKLPDTSDGTLYEYRIYYNANGTLCYASETSQDYEGKNKKVKELKANDMDVKEYTKICKDVIDWAVKTLKF